MEIKHRFTGVVLFDAPDAKTMKEAVIAARKRGAYLGGAYLGGADLRGAYLGGAYLGGADLGGAYLRGDKDNPAAKLEAFKGRAERSDGYEFLIFKSEDLGNIIRAGCRTFTLEEFREHVAQSYAGSPKAEETLRILNYLEGCLNQQKW